MQQIDVKIGVKDLKIESFLVMPAALNVSSTPEELSYKIGFQFSSPKDDKFIDFTCKIDVYLKFDSSKDLIGALQTRTVFRVNGLNRFFDRSEPGKEILDNGIGAFFLEIALNQMRGVWAAKSEHTPLQFITLPLFNSESLLHQNTTESQLTPSLTIE